MQKKITYKMYVQYSFGLWIKLGNSVRYLSKRHLPFWPLKFRSLEKRTGSTAVINPDEFWLTDNVKLNFGQASSSCPAFRASTTPPLMMPGWPKQRINNVEEFRVEIGQNGGQRGYESITGTAFFLLSSSLNGNPLKVHNILKSSKKFAF